MATRLLLALGIDLVVTAILAYGIYYRRYGRSDLLLAYVALNVGVFAVTTLLTSLPGASSDSGSACSASCPSSGCARTPSPKKRSPTTSSPSLSAS